MVAARWTLLAAICLMSCGSVLAQGQDSTERQSSSEAGKIVEVPELQIYRALHLTASDLGDILGKIFEADLKADRFAIISDPKGNRLIIRGNKEYRAKVGYVLQMIDVRDPNPREQAIDAQRYSSNSSTNNAQVERLVEELRRAGDDPGQRRSLNASLKTAVEQQFNQQQEQLQSELKALRAKVDELANLLERREREKDKICLTRVSELLTDEQTKDHEKYWNQLKQEPKSKVPMVRNLPNASHWLRSDVSTGNDDTKVYYHDLGELIRLVIQLSADHPKVKEQHVRLTSNKVTADAIQKLAGPMREALHNQEAFKRLSSSNQDLQTNELLILDKALEVLDSAGREALERWLLEPKNQEPTNPNK